MVCFKAKAKASAYLTKLGWIRGWVFVGGVCGGGGVCACVRVRGGYGWGGWDVLEGWGRIGRRGEEKLHHYTIFVTLSSLVHEKIDPINLINMTKTENKNCKCSK